MTIGLIGFAGVPALAALVTLSLSLAGAFGNGAASGQFDRQPDGVVIAYAVTLVVAGALARGAITWLALHPHSNMKDAMRAAGQRAPALLLTTCSYSLCMLLGAAGLAVWLRAGRIDSDQMVYPPATPALLHRALLAQAVDTLIPDPIALHTMVFPRLRSLAFNATVNVDLLRRLRSAPLKDSVVIGVPLNYAPATLEITLIPSIGLIVIAVSEVLWRGRAVMVMRAAPGQVLQPVAGALRFGAAHFGAISARIWPLQLSLAAVCIAGVVLPCLMMCSQVAPALARTLNAPAAYPLCAFAMSAGASIICALLATFNTVFDERLMAAIESSETIR